MGRGQGSTSLAATNGLPPRRALMQTVQLLGGLGDGRLVKVAELSEEISVYQSADGSFQSSQEARGNGAEARFAGTYYLVERAGPDRPVYVSMPGSG